ncbi:MAG TPA: hypothetical protein P5192_03870 [Fervidobacterium sp.]|nr:hypothetical protein [Fervidobacterium sp.]HRT01488.1 hypothetical protein [Fervidobacterium sp.]HRV37900.1 hypothetical protein [Fervidobacterium sp.]
MTSEKSGEPIVLDATIVFLEETEIVNFQSFILRQIKKSIKDMYCTFKKRKCAQCDFSERCYYIYFVGDSYENLGDEIPDILILDSLPTRVYKKDEEKTFKILVLRESAEKIPMFVYALNRVGTKKHQKHGFYAKKIAISGGDVLFQDGYFYTGRIDKLGTISE